jgi:hypothetical protein
MALVWTWVNSDAVGAMVHAELRIPDHIWIITLPRISN